MKRVLLVAALLIMCVAYTGAFDLRSGQTISIPQGTTVDDDLLASGSNINVAGAVTGNALVAGSTASIIGPVTGLSAVAGSMVTVSGVQGTVMAAGSNITARSLIAKNAAFAGSNIDIDETSRISRDLMAAGTNVSSRANIARDLRIGGTNITIGGTIGRDVYANGANITILPGTVIRGNLIYESVSNAKIDSGAKVLGRVEHRQPVQKHAGPSWPGRLLWAIMMTIMMFILGAIFITLFPRWSLGASQRIVTSPGWTALWGFIVLIVAPIAAFIAMITIIGIPIGVIILLSYFIALILTPIVAAIAFGSLLIKGRSPYLALLVGLLIIYILGLIPFIGWIIRFAACLFGLGAIWLNVMGNRLQPMQPAETAPAETPPPDQSTE